MAEELETTEAAVAEVKPAAGAADTKPAATETKPIPWPEDWRARAASGDDKRLKQLERYVTPEAAFDALVAAQAKIRSGELAAPLPEKATPEQVAAWREARGIPPDPKSYKLDLREEATPAEREAVQRLAERAHSANLDGKQLQTVVDWARAETEALEERDVTQRMEVEELLQEDWGRDFKTNVNLIKALFSTGPAEVFERFSKARGPDGLALTNDLDTLLWLAGLARQINPVTTNTGGAMQLHQVEDEIGKIEERMRKDRTGYFKDQKMQERYRELLSARQREQARA